MGAHGDVDARWRQRRPLPEASVIVYQKRVGIKTYRLPQNIMTVLSVAFGVGYGHSSCQPLDHFFCALPIDVQTHQSAIRVNDGPVEPYFLIDIPDHPR